MGNKILGNIEDWAGWSPEIGTAVRGTDKVHVIVDFLGGVNNKPVDSIGKYIGAGGYVDDINDATSLPRGTDGEDGKDFKYPDFTTEQLAALKGATGDKGWTPDHREEVYEHAPDDIRIIKKLIGYINGQGTPPVDNLNLYLKPDGSYTAVKAEATNYKSSASGETDESIKTKLLNNPDTNVLTDAQIEVVENTSGVNTGDQDVSGIEVNTTAIAILNEYVYNLAAGWVFKKDVKAASVSNVNIASAPALLDTITLVNGDRILLKDQSLPYQNGIYVFNGTGVALTRALDADTGAELANKTIPVNQGSVGSRNGDSWWKILNDTIVLDTTFITFSKVRDGDYIAGGQISIVGSTISVTEDATHRWATDEEKANWNAKANKAPKQIAATLSIPFDEDTIVGTNALPITTTPITTNTTGATSGVTTKLFVKRTTAPVFPATWKLAVGGGAWHATKVNRVYAQYEDSSNIFYTIASD